MIAGAKSRQPFIGKVAVMGLLERHPEGGSRIKMKVLPATRLKKRDMQSVVMDRVTVGSQISSDALKSYIGLDAYYIHNVIDHGEAYVNGHVHTNGLENFWSLLKRSIHGTYVSVQPFHLFRYLDEQAFKFNNRRDMNDAERFALTMSGITGKRLTYKALIGDKASKN